MSLLLVLSNMDFKLNLEVRTFLHLVQFPPDINLANLQINLPCNQMHSLPTELQFFGRELAFTGIKNIKTD